MKITGTMRLFLTHASIIAIFIIASFLFFYPVLEGKRLMAHDTQVFMGSSKEIQDFRQEYGTEPLWTNSMFGGMPAFLISVKFPGNLIKHLDDLLKIFKTPVAALFLALVGFYVMLLLLRVRPWLAFAGAIAYGFTSYLFISLSAGHNTKVYAMAYMAPVIGSAIYAFRTNAFKGSVLFALFLSLQIMANHIQITYYTFLILLMFGIFETIQAIRYKNLKPFFRSLILLFSGAVIAVCVNFGSLYTTWEYSQESTRGKSDLIKDDARETTGLDKEYITQWSYGIDESLTLLIPNFRGGPTESFPKDSETVKALRKNNMIQASGQLYRYWGKQPSTSGPVYFGAVILFLFIFGLFTVPARDKWWILVAVLLSLLLSWGKNLMFFSSLFIDFFPGYDRFRAVSMILVMAGVCVPLLGVLALKEVAEGNASKEKILKALKIAAAVTGGLAFVFFLFPGLAGSFLRPDEAAIPDSYAWLKDAMIADRKAWLRADALRSAILIASGSMLLWLFLRNKIKPSYTITILILLLLLDQVPVDARYLNESKFISKREQLNTLAPSAADKAILEDKSEFRVLNLTVSTFNDASTSYYHNSIGGYSGAKMKRYQELIEASISREIDALITRLQTAVALEEAEIVLASSNAINMLNAKYIILSPDAPPLTNKYALGNAWFVTRARIVENADTELNAISSFNPSDEAVVDARFKEQLSASAYDKTPGDTITLTSYRANQLTYESILASDRIAVFSEIYYPHGWKAFIDDKPAGHFRVNYVLRGMTVPAGNHTITFRFEPQSYKTGNRVSMAGSIVLLTLLAFASFRSIVPIKRNE